MWVCTHCLEISEDDQWEECWNCGRVRDRSAVLDEDAQRKLDEHQAKVRELEAFRDLLRRCPRCEGEMKFRGHREVPYNLRGNLSYYDTEKVVLYACTRCGKLESFLANVGAGLRGDP